MGKVVTWLVGLAALVAASAATFVLVRARFEMRVAVGVTAAVMLLPPLLVAVLLGRSLRRVDASSTFVGNAIGLLGLWAGIVVVGVFVLARERVLPRMPIATPTSTSTSTSTSTATATATAASTPTPTPTPTATSTADAAIEVTLVAKLGDIDGPSWVGVADFDGDGIDEVIVRTFTLLCAEGERCVTRGVVHVIGVAKEADELVELHRFEPTIPEQQAPIMGIPAAADVDADGKLDLLSCVTFTALGGGTRGGATQVALGRGDRTFAAPVILDRAPCTAVAMQDVTGDKKPELVIVNRGNPWQAEQPNGSIAWQSRVGKSWKAAGRLAAGVDPDQVDFTDLDGDGITDAIVTHGWDVDRKPLAYRGSKTGLRMMAADAGMEVPVPPRARSVRARLDDDGVDDRVAIEEANATATVAFYRSKPRPAGLIMTMKPAK